MKTQKKPLQILTFTALLIFANPIGAAPVPANGKLKIFILSGQSNMVGYGQVAGSPGTMETYVKSNPKAYGHLVDENKKQTLQQWKREISNDHKLSHPQNKIIIGCEIGKPITSSAQIWVKK